VHAFFYTPQIDSPIAATIPLIASGASPRAGCSPGMILVSLRPTGMPEICRQELDMNNLMTENDCIFCNIVAGNADARIVYKDDYVTAFHDQHPITPVHILIVPNKHIPSVNHVESEDETVLGRLVTVGRRLAVDFGLYKSGYRLAINTGPDAGQSVFHLHMHLIGGTHMPFRFE
jgi:histidine triad (HIT) family protein